MEEMWEMVPGYEGLYQISSAGKVYSLGKQKELRPNMVWSGYKMVRLSKKGWSRDYSIHRLVAITFLDNHNNYRVVNHKDGDKVNNYWLNLEWTTDSENQLHAIRTGLKRVFKGEECGASKLKEKDIAVIKDLYYNQGLNLTKISVLYNVHFSTIQRVIKNKNWSYLGDK